jgi:hypothetical protein
MKHFQDLCGIEIYIDGELCLSFLFHQVFQLICHYGSWKVKSYISVATLETKVWKVQKTIDALIEMAFMGNPWEIAMINLTNLFLMLLKEKKQDFMNIYICQFSLFVTFQTCLKKKIKHFITVLEVHKLILVYFFEKIDRTCIYGLMKSHKVFFDNNLLLIGLFQWTWR